MCAGQAVLSAKRHGRARCGLKQVVERPGQWDIAHVVSLDEHSPDTLVVSGELSLSNESEVLCVSPRRGPEHLPVERQSSDGIVVALLCTIPSGCRFVVEVRCM
jgi:hypothetical protein